MKTLITVMLTLTIAVCSGQRRTLENHRINKDTIIGWGGLVYQEEVTQLARLPYNSDTLEITSPKVKFIKIDGKVFEIKRDVKLEEVQQGWKPYKQIYDTMYTPFIRRHNLDSLLQLKN